LATHRGRAEEAETSYRTALSVNPDFVPGYVNLADLYRSQGREEATEAILRDGIGRLPDQGVLHESLGLLLVRNHRMAEAIDELRMAAESPDAGPRRLSILRAPSHRGTSRSFCGS
ncbi:MAG: hypothetical protein ACE5G3_10955, partial [Gammaproteobacteria bacterium]